MSIAQRPLPELLAPAGGLEQLHYAIRFGADAVYLAGQRFGMRQRAANFTLAEMRKAVEIAHAHGVRVHVTCNTVMHEADMGELTEYLQELSVIGIDAVIVSDLGAFSLAIKHAPRLAIHVSTQASVSNSEAARMWHSLGASRIVAARELSLTQIAKMREQLPSELEIECFVHGAMCMAYSGRCLISDYTTGRSALTGHCAQSCRWSYALVEEQRPGEYFPIEEDESGTYLLNAQDLNMLSHVHELVDAGIDSLKIEGRNKKAYYVATVVNAYRQALDGKDFNELAHELECVSHRPYSTGFFFGPAHQTHDSIDYIRTCEWAAQVLECTEIGRGRYSIRVCCRNKFGCDSRLEALSPHKPIRAVHIEDLRFIDASLGPVTVDVANRTNEQYLFTSDRALEPYDIIRAYR